MIGDALMLNLALLLGLWLRNFFNFNQNQYLNLFNPMNRLFVIGILILFVVGLYDVGRAKNTPSFFKKIFIGLGIWLAVGLLYFYLFPKNNAQPKTILAITALCAAIMISLWRFLYNKYLSRSIAKTTVMFVGLTQEVLEIIEKIQKEPELGYETTGLIFGPETPMEWKEKLSSYQNSSTLPTLLEKISQPINLIVVAPAFAQNKEINDELFRQLLKQTGVVSLEKFYEDILKRIPPFTFSESWFLANLEEQKKKIYDRSRNLIDFFFAILMALVFAITFPLIAFLVKINSPGPIFFTQNRVGRNGKIFRIIKYRTMKALAKDGSAETNGAQYAGVNDNRITTLGKFLRKTRLDELPQFINIFKNEMALIGPRPERPEFVAELVKTMPYYSLRHLVKPGLTGWAQIQKSYYGTIEENLRKLEFDLYYLKNRGPLLDFSIILRTFNVLGGMKGR